MNSQAGLLTPNSLRQCVVGKLYVAPHFFADLFGGLRAVSAGVADTADADRAAPSKHVQRILASRIGFLAAAVSIAAVGMAATSTTTPPAHVFRAGAATSNITPPLGAGIVGGWSDPPATHIHDELHVRCLVLDDGTTRLAFAVVDNVQIPRSVFDAAKRMIHETTGLAPGNVMMSATHTHSSASARGSSALLFNQPLDEYQNFLVRRISDGVRRAINNLEPARIGWGTGQVPQHVFNRRWLLKDGKTAPSPFGDQDRTKTNPGSYLADLLQPAGPTNPEVYFVSVQSSGGRPIALLANYWLHYVGGIAPRTFSADYFGAFCDQMTRLLGDVSHDPPFVGILANGPCGDVTNNNYAAYGKPAAKRYAPYEKMRLVAGDVAHEIMRVYPSVQHRSQVELRAAHAELELKMRRATPAVDAWADRVMARPAISAPTQQTEAIFARRVVEARAWPETASIPLQVFRIGDLGIAAIPFETFTETGLEIKARSPFKDTFTIELANGGYGYLPTPEQHELGGYESWFTINRVEREASRKIVAKLLALFTEVRQ